MERTIPGAQRRTHSLVLTGLFAALGCVSTMVLVLPSPTGGYMNLGDAVVLLGAYLLGPVWGAVAGGLGPALADLLAGYTAYVPATLAIKAVMGLAAGLLFRALREKQGDQPFRMLCTLVFCGLVGEIPMVAGYWLYDGILMGSLAGSALGIPSNLAQAAFGVTASTLLALALRKSRYVRRQFPGL